VNKQGTGREVPFWFSRISWPYSWNGWIVE